MNLPTAATTLIILCMLAAPALGADGGVVRSVSTDTLAAGGTVEVTLALPQGSMMGIVETVPDGFAFAGTTQPEGRYKVTGRQIIFSAVNETAIAYTLRADAGGSGTITGLWEDVRTGTSGETPATRIIAAAAAAGAATPDPHKSPGFGLIAAAGAALVAGRRCLR
ncbi:hypothetical protein E2N92_12340 [Methanofollis formosanus]|uniref:Uncharacterized protein n=1 Tax=Methanofollis formosanus TaxID=299308 RepID=A0A8G1EGU3_9EURY|nr:hypothetical protein [Methanofollis formosanus]QYZ80160.1 hypothetical protein E2N92_12340 [Methanofollis formosanus]